jgi:uncharacterized membrane protein
MRLSSARLSAARLFSVGRTVTALVSGIAVGVIAVVAGQRSLAPTLGWTVASGVLLAWVWRRSWPLGPAGTKDLAEAEGSAVSMDGFLLVAAVASLAVVVNVLASEATGATPVLLAVVSAILSWALVNTVYAFKYARFYYVDEDGGIDFNQEQPPSYSDFAYMAFTIGASFAVSDNNISSTAVRKAVLVHALLSYAFGTLIIAVAINLVTNVG